MSFWDWIVDKVGYVLNYAFNGLSPAHFIIVAVCLFGLGLFGVMARRNAIAILISIELMLNGVALSAAAFASAWGPDRVIGFAFAAFVMVVAAAEAIVGLAIVLNVYRRFGAVIAEKVNLFKW
jgi:NADH:ubiquinone oxidoreductase subunit K